MSRTDEDDEQLRSRTDLSNERKAEEKRLAALASSLVGLPHKQLAKLELEEGLRDAVDEARRMKAHAARARQLRIVRRELRDGDSQAIAAAVDELLNPRGSPTPAKRAAEGWAERLIADSAALESFLADYPQAERQRLRTLARNARKAEAGRAAKARKVLLAALQAWMQEPRSDGL